MLTQTSISAIRTLVHLALRNDPGPVSPREIAARLGESPTYLAKVTGHLVRAGILRARRGVAGGVVLHRSPREVTLLSIVEACQGTIHGNFCDDSADLAGACAFHRAGAELHDAIVGVLSRWTLAGLVEKPCASRSRSSKASCWLEPLGIARAGKAPRLHAMDRRRPSRASARVKGLTP